MTGVAFAAAASQARPLQRPIRQPVVEMMPMLLAIIHDAATVAALRSRPNEPACLRARRRRGSKCARCGILGIEWGHVVLAIVLGLILHIDDGSAVRRRRLHRAVRGHKRLRILLGRMANGPTTGQEHGQRNQGFPHRSGPPCICPPRGSEGLRDVSARNLLNCPFDICPARRQSEYFSRARRNQLAWHNGNSLPSSCKMKA